MDAFLMETDGRVPICRNVPPQGSLPSVSPWLVSFSKIPGNKSIRKHNCYRMNASPMPQDSDTFQHKHSQMMLLTFKPFCRSPPLVRHLNDDQKCFVKNRFLSSMLILPGSFNLKAPPLSQAEQKRETAENNHGENCREGEFPNPPYVYMIQSSNSLPCATFTSLSGNSHENPSKDNGQAGYEETIG